MTVEADLLDGDIELSGRIMSASNSTFVGTISIRTGDDIAVVYKPVSGERPLWDFPDGNLARREAAAYLVSESFGWDVVPHTWLREGPHGIGMVQLWQEPDPEQEAVTLVASDAVPDGWRHVLDGYDATNQAVSLIHEDSVPLRRMALFDAVTNNADRKGGHVLEMVGGHRYGVDHGLTFHVEPKLRTVLWGWVGQDLDPDEVTGVERVRSDLDGVLGAALSALLVEQEVAALIGRCDRLLRRGRFPSPRGQMPAVPWPPF